MPAWEKGLGISLALGITAAFFVFFKYLDDNTTAGLLELRAGCLALTALLFFMLWAIEGLRIKLLVHTFCSRDLRIADGIRIFLFTFFFASVTPFAAGEWPAHVYALNRHGLSLGESSAVTVIRSISSKMVFLGAGLLMLLLFGGAGAPVLVGRAFTLAVLAVAANLLVLFFLLWRPAFLEHLLKRFLSRFPLAASWERSSRVHRLYDSFLKEMRNFRWTTLSINRWKTGRLLLVVLLTAAYWLIFFSIAYTILRGLNIALPFVQVLRWQVVMQLILAYIPLPGGSGAAELGLAALFRVMVPSAALGIFVIVWRFFTYYMLLFFGSLAALGALRRY